MNQGPSAEDFSKSQWEWRTKREASLTKPGGWLSVAGLYWVQEGSQTIGSAESCDIQFPSSAPAKVGTIELKNGVVTLHPRDGVEVSVNGKPLSGPLKTDATGKPDRVKLGDLEFSIIIRGKRTGIRLWDPNSKFRKRFEGCKWFEPDSKYVVKAKYTAYNPARTLSIVNILGDTEHSPNPGYVEFDIDGKPQRLEAIQEGDEFFFNFRDATSGKETYPAGRFLYSGLPKDGFVEIDFNKAYNPPCAFTAFATCPLPPKGNTLKVKIAAGELSHHPE